MQFGARNQIKATVTSVKKGDIMAQVRFTVKNPCQMESVLTTDSVNELALNPGHEVMLVIKAIHVIPVKE
jgi:molybdate transport system regulatory protein